MNVQPPKSTRQNTFQPDDVTEHWWDHWRYSNSSSGKQCAKFDGNQSNKCWDISLRITNVILILVWGKVISIIKVICIIKVISIHPLKTVNVENVLVIICYFSPERSRAGGLATSRVHGEGNTSKEVKTTSKTCGISEDFIVGQMRFALWLSSGSSRSTLRITFTVRYKRYSKGNNISI